MAGLIPLILKPAAAVAASSVSSSPLVVPASNNDNNNRNNNNKNNSKNHNKNITPSISTPPKEEGKEYLDAPARPSSSFAVLETSGRASSWSHSRSRSRSARNSQQSSSIPISISNSNRFSGRWPPDSTTMDAKRRLSLPLNMAMAMFVLPKSPAEWAKVLAEVKRHFVNRRFRQCAARCNEILSTTKDRTVEPAYLIFLNFYAAASLESTIRTLHSSSPYRLRVLQQVREHYAVADQLARDEDDSVSRASRRSSSNSCYSIRTASSRAATTSTGVSSPTQSMYYSSAPLKKRVTFDGEAASMIEPIIRPDSPTLGFEDWLMCSNPETTQSDDRRRQQQQQQQRRQQHVVRHVEPEFDSTTVTAADEDDDLDDFMNDDPFDRYASAISDLRAQISTHLSNVDVQIRLRPVSGVPGLTDAEEKEKLRKLELRARIEKLRSTGWQRKRFDPKRYHALYDEVTSELSRNKTR